MSKITLPISSIKSYLNKAMVFINKSKVGLHPLYCCFYFKDDKVYTNNGETGGIISVPMTVSTPTLLFPFDLMPVINNSRDDSDITFDFDYTEMFCRVSAQHAKLKIKLMDPSTFTPPIVPDDLEYFEIEGFYEKVRRAKIATNIDASLPIMQGIGVTKISMCSTDQRALWAEECQSPQDFIIPNLLREHIEKLGVEPAKIGINKDSIYLFYQDMVMFSRRLGVDVGEGCFPGVNAVFARSIRAIDYSVIVEYDRETLRQKLEALALLPCPEGAIKISCKENNLQIQNLITDSDTTQSDTSLAVNSTGDFDDVFINAELFKSGVERFIQFKLSPKFIYFTKDSQEYCVMRRDVR